LTPEEQSAEIARLKTIIDHLHGHLHLTQGKLDAARREIDRLKGKPVEETTE